MLYEVLGDQDGEGILMAMVVANKGTPINCH